jgi:putative cardiolipin synthase
LLARLALIDGAKRTLDLKYYLWDSDAVGYLFLSRLIAAADRGVDVRLLVDDLKLRNRMRSITSLCRHPNLEIRVFNPWQHRHPAHR